MLAASFLTNKAPFFSKVGFNYLIYGIASIIIQVIIINILGLLNSNLIYDFNSLTIISAICNYILPFPILIYLMGKIDSQTPEKNTLTVEFVIEPFSRPPTIPPTNLAEEAPVPSIFPL